MINIPLHSLLGVNKSVQEDVQLCLQCVEVKRKVCHLISWKIQ